MFQQEDLRIAVAEAWAEEQRFIASLSDVERNARGAPKVAGLGHDS
jgi:hypothetical protein